MKIDRSYTPAAIATPPANPVKPNSTPAASREETDVTLSDAAKLAAAEMTAPLDIGRIEEIKRAIAEGQFKINSGAIADRLLDSARELLGAQKKA